MRCIMQIILLNFLAHAYAKASDLWQEDVELMNEDAACEESRASHTDNLQGKLIDRALKDSRLNHGDLVNAMLLKCSSNTAQYWSCFGGDGVNGSSKDLLPSSASRSFLRKSWERRVKPLRRYVIPCHPTSPDTPRATIAHTAATSHHSSGRRAGRHAQKQDRSSVEIAGNVNFTFWPGCQECSTMLGRLLQGIDDAGYLRSATWENNVLTAKLTSDSGNAIFGQIASRSRVPLMWKVDKRLTFTIANTAAKTSVSVEGLSLWGSAQAFSVYQGALKNANLDGSTCVGSLADWTCIQKEIEAAGKYLDHKWWEKIENDSRKVTIVMKTMYGGAPYWALKAANKWPTVFYSIITTTPRRITSFEFEDGMVSAVGEPDETHPAFADYQRLNLFEKSSIMGAKSLLDCPKNLFEMAISKAQSGMNLAMMLSSGNRMTRGPMMERGIEPGHPTKIGNLMAWCKDSPPGSDPQCSGSTPGRVAWGPGLPNAMDDHHGRHPKRI